MGKTVDANATRTNTIGAPELITVRTDPEFDPETPAFYYARILEIPTPRTRPLGKRTKSRIDQIAQTLETLTALGKI